MYADGIYTYIKKKTSDSKHAHTLTHTHTHNLDSPTTPTYGIYYARNPYEGIGILNQFDWETPYYHYNY